MNRRTFPWHSAALLLLLLSLNGCIVGAIAFGAAGALVIKEGFIRDLRWIIVYLHRLEVAGKACRHLFIRWVFLRPPGIAGYDFDYSGQLFEIRFYAPKATAGKSGYCLSGCICWGLLFFGRSVGGFLACKEKEKCQDDNKCCLHGGFPMCLDR